MGLLLLPLRLRQPRSGGDAKIRRSVSFDDFINHTVEGKPHILPQGQPWRGLWMLRKKVEIFLGPKLDSNRFCVGHFLDCGIEPLAAVEKEILTGDKLGVLCV